ncbi:MAG: GNAT family N-acetyltransferase [Deltaproteobacteria bacterium]|nr:GNAT family N-acetyltransferase [Deltaproteobacteria bacterium]
MPSEPAWKAKITTHNHALSGIRPGMSIFLGTGVAEPRSLIRAFTESSSPNLRDLELIQLVSLGETISIADQTAEKYRLKTFFSGWIASEAIREGRVDLIPCPFSRVPLLIESGTIHIDVAFVQITPFDESGYASLGPAVDVARQAMSQASFVVGEINPTIPRTMGDTFVRESEFDLLVESSEPPITFDRWTVDEVHDKIGRNVASLIQDGSCIAFSVGPIFDALARHLSRKKDLGIHSPFFTDPLMELVRSGAVTNRKKRNFKGKSVASYALGTQELMKWLDGNPLLEFQGIDVAGDPTRMGRNDRFMVVLPARRIDLTGGVALPHGRGNVGTGPGEAQELFKGAALSTGGRTIFGLPSRNPRGGSNILLSVMDFPNQFSARESLDLVVTEYGIASLTGRTIRERALALIDIAHPDDRAELVRKAKAEHILYPDQVYHAEQGHHYPEELSCMKTFKDGLEVRFRPIRPSDVDEMRRLFYRFSDESVYYRYFSPVKTMPHTKMQEYANVDYRNSMSIVGLVGEPGEGRIVAEGRYVLPGDTPFADVAFVVDEAYKGKGIATFLFHYLIRIAQERGIQGFTADVLASNKAMIKVLERSPYPAKAVMASGVYEFSIPFRPEQAAVRDA